MNLGDDSSSDFYKISVKGESLQGTARGPANFSKEELVQAMSAPATPGNNPTDLSTESRMSQVLSEPLARYSSIFVRQWLEGFYGNPEFGTAEAETLVGNFPFLATTATLRFPKTKEFADLDSDDVYSRGYLGGMPNQTSGDYVVSALIATDGPLDREFLKIRQATDAAKSIFLDLPAISSHYFS